MAVRSTILTNLVSQLGTITVANGYATDVARVLADVKHSQESNVGPGKIAVEIEDEGDGEIAHTGAGHKSLLSMHVIARATIEGPVGGGVPYDLASKWLGDVRKLVAKPIVLGTNVRMTAVGAVPPINLSGSDAIVHLPLEIVYWQDEDAP